MKSTKEASRSEEGLGTLSTIPGPKGQLLLGNLLQLDVPRLHLQLEAWSREYGSLYHLRLGNKDVIVASDPEEISTIMKSRPDTWRRVTEIAECAREDGFIGLFAAEGDEWRRQRRLVMTAFAPAHLRGYTPHIRLITDRLRRRWAELARRGERFELRSELMRYTVDAAAVLSYGQDLNTLEDETSELQSHLQAVLPMLYRRILMPFAYWRLVRLPVDRAYDRHVAAIQHLIGELVRSARAQLERTPERRHSPSNLLEAMLIAQDDDGSVLTDADITGNVFTMLLASQDTTANTLAWAISLLHKNPQAWHRLVQETQSVLGDQLVPQDLDQMYKMRFAEACANEAMRLKPVAPIIVLEALHDTTVRGYAIPKGCRAYLLPRPSAVEHEALRDPLEFQPQRWLGEDGHGDFPKRISTPFGAGPRICPGRYLAMIEIGMVLAMIARNFRLAELGDKDGAPPEERLAFTMFPTDLYCRLVPA